MKAKSDKEKDSIKLSFAVLVWKLLKASKYKSAREFALDIGLEPAHVQKIIRENKDVAITTVVTIAEGFGISMGDFGKEYENITRIDINAYKKDMEEQKRLKGKR